jgi:hypothetical protein
VNQWIAHLPEDHPLAQQHTLLLQATNSITWTSAHSRQLAVSNGLRILLVRGYDSLHHIKDDDLKLLAVRWSKGTDALDAALCSLGVFSRTPKRGSARHGRRWRMTAQGPQPGGFACISLHEMIYFITWIKLGRAGFDAISKRLSGSCPSLY